MQLNNFILDVQETQKYINLHLYKWKRNNTYMPELTEN